jgi:hypothetical protein
MSNADSCRYAALFVAAYSGLYTCCLGAAGPGFCLAASAGLLAKEMDHRARSHETTVTCRDLGNGPRRCLGFWCHRPKWGVRRYGHPQAAGLGYAICH